MEVPEGTLDLLKGFDCTVVGTGDVRDGAAISFGRGGPADDGLAVPFAGGFSPVVGSDLFRCATGGDGLERAGGVRTA